MSRPDPAPATVVLYGAPGCHLCEAARATVDAHLAARVAQGLQAPPVSERDIHADDRLLRAFVESIPVIEVGSARLELATSPTRIRAFLDAALGVEPATGLDEALGGAGPRAGGAGG